jgi:hypothetical protein
MTCLMQICNFAHGLFARKGDGEYQHEYSMEPISAAVVIVALLAMAC